VRRAAKAHVQEDSSRPGHALADWQPRRLKNCTARSCYASAVRDEVAHSDSLQARRDFGPVTDSYRAVQHELGIYPGRDEYVPPA